MAGITKKGYTFLQLIVAIFILGTALSPIMLMNIQNTKKLQKNSEYLDSVMVATTIMDQARQKDKINMFSGKKINIKKDNDMGFELNGTFFDIYNPEIKIEYKLQNKNFIYIFLNMEYTNSSKNTSVVELESGVFLNVY